MDERGGSAGVDRDWNDEDVLPPVLSPDTEFVFRRMTEETLKAVGAAPSIRVLDVGCGRGIDAASLARQGAILFGCEPSRVMLRKAQEESRRCRGAFWVVSSCAENLPFSARAFPRVVCKGAIDHFLCPERAVAEMCRVTSPGGRVVLSVANLESLSCLLSRNLHRFVRRVSGKGIPPPHIWEIPRDHTYKFDYGTTVGMAGRYLRLEMIRGVSLLWGFPRWSEVLKKIRPSSARVLLQFLDRIADRRPAWSDVLIVAGTPRPGMERSS